MDEFRALLESIPHSYDDFVSSCIQEFGDDPEKREKLTRYILSRQHENPGDIVKFICDELLELDWYENEDDLTEDDEDE